MNKLKIKFLLLAMLSFSMVFAQSPAYLSGTSYTQNFDNLSAGLPIGWRVDTLVDNTAGLGDNAISKYVASNSAWNITSRGFYNYAAADGTGMTATATSTDQNNCVDRALGVKQVSAWDATANQVSFDFLIANTTGLSSLSLNFKLQTFFQSSSRNATWIVQYGLGTAPTTFTTATTVPATLYVDSNFTNTSVSVNFGSALNNQSQNVWIRITPSGPSTGAGNRPIVAIDDFNLTWTGTASGPLNPQIATLTPTNGATGVMTNADLIIDFDKNVSVGTGVITIKNLTDATQQTITLPNANVTTSGMTATITGNSFLNSKNYAVRFDSTCFKSGTYNSFGIYNDVTWQFTTINAAPSPVNSLNETFTNCATPNLGVFSRYSVTGSKEWSCTTFGHNDSAAVYMNGYAGGSQDNEDWLISPPLSMSTIAKPTLHYWSKRRFSGNNTKEIFVSTNYSGVGDPNVATWTNLNVASLGNLDTVWKQYLNVADLTSYKGSNFFIAFKYVSSSTGTADEWDLDDIWITDGPLAVSNFDKERFSVSVYNATNNHLNFISNSELNMNMDYKIVGMNGAMIQEGEFNINVGKQQNSMLLQNLSSGMYFLHLSNAQGFAVLKFVIE